MRRGTTIGGLLALALTGATTVACAPPAPPAYSFALIGDAPYGSAAMAAFPQLVDQINADLDVEFVAHAGDIRGRDSDCSDATLRATYDLYQRFEGGFWLTPGDNDWFDCHRAGGYLPPERLAFLRSLLYANPTRTTGGRPIEVVSQASSSDPALRQFVENTLFSNGCVTFGAVHVIGYGDGIEPWSGVSRVLSGGLGDGDQRDLRLSGNTARRTAALAWVDEIFDTAAERGAAGVFLLMQAEPVDDVNYVSLRQKVLERARAFGKPVVLAHGDAHQYVNTIGYGGVPNLTRIETAGDEAAIDEWIEMKVDCASPAVFGWERREFTVRG